jgi:hypothetical protein
MSTGGIPGVSTGVASDGSYVWAKTNTALNIWRPDGTILVGIAGSYGLADIFAAPGELRIARGPAEGMIETIRVPSGARTLVPYDGVFHSWFLDGARFLAFADGTYRAVNLDGTLAGRGSIGGHRIVGQGDHVWVYSEPGANRLDIYNVATFERAQTYTFGASTQLYASGRTIAVADTNTSTMSVIHLEPVINVSPPITLPVTSIRSYATDDDDDDRWLIGNAAGVVLPGAGTTPAAPLSKGIALSASGTVGGTAAIATGVGSIYLLAVGEPTTVIRTLPQSSDHVELTTDGMQLLAGPNFEFDAFFTHDFALRLYDVATGSLIRSWPYQQADVPAFRGYSLARTGLVMAHYFAIWPGYVRRLLRTDGTALPDYGEPFSMDPIYFYGVHRFSPDGRRAALCAASELPVATTTIYRDAAATRMVDGVVLGWLSDDRVLVARYAPSVTTPPPLVGTTIYDDEGEAVAIPPLPDLFPHSRPERGLPPAIYPAGGGLIYSPVRNAVYDPVTAALLWQGPVDDPLSPVRTRGLTTAGDFVLYVRGATIFVERFRT